VLDVQLDDEDEMAYAGFVTKGTSMPEHGSEPEASERSDDPEGAADQLAPSPDETSADAFLMYPRGRYLDARRGLVSPRDFARDLGRHVRSQLLPRHAAAGDAAATIRQGN
jgi:hypothetical protein